MVHIWGGTEQDNARFQHTTQISAQFNLYKLFISGFINLIFWDHSWLQVPETMENKTVDKRGLLYILLFSCSVVSNSFRPYGLQHGRLPCPSLSPGVCSNSCPSGRWCHPTNYPLSPPSPPALNLSLPQGLFQWVGSLIRWPKYWSFSFSISPPNECLGLISSSIVYIPLVLYTHTHTHTHTYLSIQNHLAWNTYSQRHFR